ncbi:pollen-specific leucine-rich repeat extensin-like protein 1 isoform X2 [Drosophila ananassae]|nr:pollen-specific leucine-rich repeat extensin-like protein 1 isoform X2 [Drosophila ananassae]
MDPRWKCARCNASLGAPGGSGGMADPPRKSNAGRKKRVLSDPLKAGKPEKMAKLEVKSEEQKNEEQKSEEHKDQEQKPEELKPEEPKQEELKIEEPKPEELRPEEPKDKDPETEEPKAEEQKQEEPKNATQEDVVAKEPEMSSLGELEVKIKQEILSPEQGDEEPQADPLDEPLDEPMNLLLDQLLHQPQDPVQDEPQAQPLIQFPEEELQVVPLVEFPDDEPPNEESPEAHSLTPTPENALALVGPVADLRNIPVATWTVDQVVGFVGRHYPREASAFRFQDIDGASLLLLTRNDVMNGFGLKLGPALRVFELVMCLQNGNDDVRLAWFE